MQKKEREKEGKNKKWKEEKINEGTVWRRMTGRKGKNEKKKRRKKNNYGGGGKGKERKA